jgi:hypothetical protein
MNPSVTVITWGVTGMESDVDNLPLKRCSTCKEFKTLDYFNKDKSRKDGFSWRCKSCHSEMNKKYSKTPDAKEIARQRAYERYHANKDEINAKAREDRANKPELKRAYARAWRAKRKDSVNERTRNWRLNNPEKHKESTRANKNRRRGAKVEYYTTQQAIDLYGSDCHLCGEAIDLDAPRWTAIPGWERGLHLDHVTRISEGGKDCLENVRPSHALCNLQKH